MTALLSRVLYSVCTGDHICVVQSMEGYSNPPSSPFLHIRRMLPLFLLTISSLRGVPACGESPAAKERECPDLRTGREGEREVVKKNPRKQNNPNQTSSVITGELIESLLSLAYLPAFGSRAVSGERRLLPLRGRKRCAGAGLGAEQCPPCRRGLCRRGSASVSGKEDGVLFQDTACLHDPWVDFIACICFRIHILPSITHITVL